jgi:hypothetical protein
MEEVRGSRRQQKRNRQRRMSEERKRPVGDRERCLSGRTHTGEVSQTDTQTTIWLHFESLDFIFCLCLTVSVPAYVCLKAVCPSVWAEGATETEGETEGETRDLDTKTTTTGGGG